MITLNSRHIFWWTILLLAVAMSSWFAYGLYKITGSEPKYNTKNPDSIVLGVKGWQMNKTGDLVLRFQSPKLIHFSEKDATLIQSPHFTYYQKDKMPWSIQSRKGKAVDGLDILYLWDHVTMNQPKGPNNYTTQIKTEAVTIFPNKRFAKTKHLVTINQPGSMIESKGMIVDLERGEASLLANAQGRYDPTYYQDRNRKQVKRHG